MSLPVSLQLYTVRDPLSKDFEGTLAQIAKIGFKYVEFAGFYDRTPAQVKAICDKLGLKASSAHIPIESIRDNFDGAISAAKTLGIDYIIVPWVGDEFRGVDGYKKLAALLNELAVKAAAQGITLCYHNHSFEFEKQANGQTGWDILFGTPSKFSAELDVYWVVHGHHDPIKTIHSLAGRVPLLHIKDLSANADRIMTEVGTGIIDMKPIVAAAPGAGVKFLILEQDTAWKGSPLESVQISYSNFIKIAG